MPCHFSGNGRSDFASSLSSATSTDSSPVLLLTTSPRARDDVAQIPLLELAVERFAEPVALDHELDLTGAILQPHEADAAADALHHHAPGDLHGDRLRGQRLRAVRLICRQRARRPARRAGSRSGTRLPVSRNRASFARRSAISRFSGSSSSLVPYRPCFKLSCRNSSRSPSSTCCGRALSRFVRKSFTRD